MSCKKSTDDRMVEKRVAAAIVLWVGYSGVLDTMPPGKPNDIIGNAEWIEDHFRPFLSAATGALEASHFKELVAAAKRCENFLLNHQRSLGIEDGSVDELECTKMTRAVLAKVKDEGHG